MLLQLPAMSIEQSVSYTRPKMFARRFGLSFAGKPERVRRWAAKRFAEYMTSSKDVDLGGLLSMAAIARSGAELERLRDFLTGKSFVLVREAKAPSDAFSDKRVYDRVTVLFFTPEAEAEAVAAKKGLKLGDGEVIVRVYVKVSSVDGLPRCNIVDIELAGDMKGLYD